MSAYVTLKLWAVVTGSVALVDANPDVTPGESLGEPLGESLGESLGEVAKGAVGGTLTGSNGVCAAGAGESCPETGFVLGSESVGISALEIFNTELQAEQCFGPWEKELKEWKVLIRWQTEHLISTMRINPFEEYSS